MKLKFKGNFNVMQITNVVNYINANLLDISVMEKPIFVYDVKISRLSKYKFLIEGE